MKPVAVVEHEAAAPAGLLGEWLDARGIEWLVVRQGADAGTPAGWSAVVSLGSSHAAYEADGWVPGHVELLREVVATGIPVLGLCFGSQALGIALGASGHRADEPEIGWVSPDSSQAQLHGPWFSWHSDTISTPPDATVIATTSRAMQAYVAGRHVGLQFHPEVTAAIARTWIEDEPETAERHGPPGLAESVEKAEPALRDRAFVLFDWWWRYAVLTPGDQ